MKKFKTKKKINHYVDLMLIIILLTTLVFLHYYNKQISPKVLDIASSKLEEISTLYIKKNITPTSANLDELINIYKNDKDEIISVDVDMDYSLKIMLDVVNKIQENIFSLEHGNIEDFSNAKELKSHDGNIYLSVPISLAYDGLLFSNLGPKVPVKLSFFEHVIGNVDTTITPYGINNALLKVYLTITLEQKLIIPYKEEKFKRDYSLVIGSKVITGKVPSFYGSSINSKSSLIELDC